MLVLLLFGERGVSFLAPSLAKMLVAPPPHRDTLKGKKTLGDVQAHSFLLPFINNQSFLPFPPLILFFPLDPRSLPSHLKPLLLFLPPPPFHSPFALLLFSYSLSSRSHLDSHSLGLSPHLLRSLGFYPN